MGRLKFDLREAMQDYEARTGIHLTYEILSQNTGLAVDTLKSMATRDDYNATLKVISILADMMACDPTHYLRWDSASKPNLKGNLPKI